MNDERTTDDVAPLDQKPESVDYAEQIASLQQQINNNSERTIDELATISQAIDTIQRQLLPKPQGEIDEVLVSDIQRQLVDLVGSLDALLVQNLSDSQQMAIRQAVGFIKAAHVFVGISTDPDAWVNESRS